MIKNERIIRKKVRMLTFHGITHEACDYLLKPVQIEEINNIWQQVVRIKRFDRKDRYNYDSHDKLCADSSKVKRDEKCW